MNDHSSFVKTVISWHEWSPSRKGWLPEGGHQGAVRAPIALYRARLGFFLGKRFVMLEHTGRKSGLIRRTVLEVVARHSDAVYVAAGWGNKSHWLKNVRADPDAAFYMGSKRFETTAEEISADEALAVVGEYAGAHPRLVERLAPFMLDDPGETPG